MGDNEIKLVKEYLRLAEILEKLLEQDKSMDNALEIIKTQERMAGMVFAYETYTAAHWSTFKALVEKYHSFNR